jgi:hypothetical protein
VAILDEESLLATCAYIDLNPVAAGIAATPEASPYTSVKARVDHATEQGRTADLEAAEQGSVAGSRASAGIEESLWLCPIEDRRRLDSAREGMLEGFSLGSYLLLVDYTGRLFREGLFRANWPESSLGWAAVRRSRPPNRGDSSVSKNQRRYRGVYANSRLLICVYSRPNDRSINTCIGATVLGEKLLEDLKCRIATDVHGGLESAKRDAAA